MSGRGDNDSKRARILDAAFKVFSRHGYARTTIGDIAGEASLSRPSVYAIFPGKEEILMAVVDAYTSDRMLDIRAGLSPDQTLAEKLAFACNAWTSPAVEAFLANPDARDLLHMPLASVGAANLRFQSLLTEILDDVVDETRTGRSARDLARMIACSVHGFVEMTTSKDEMALLIETLASTLAAALAAPPSGDAMGAAP